MNILQTIGRTRALFDEDVSKHEAELKSVISDSRILVIGGAGTIGQAVTREFFKRDPKALHVVDISENNMVELVRDIRSTLGYGSGDFQTLPLDVGSRYFDAFLESQAPYDIVCNLSALKHVRSEKDPYTLMRMLEVNVFNTVKTARQSAAMGARKWPVYFFTSDTTGEKAYEEFFMGNETLDFDRFQSLGVIKNTPDFDPASLEAFETGIAALRQSPGPWKKADIVEWYLTLLPELSHEEKGKYLDSRM